MAIYNDPIKEQIYNIIKNNIEHNESIDLMSQFEDIGIHSISFIKIIIELETIYDFETDDAYLIYTTYENIGDFIDKMSNHIKESL